MDVRVMAWAPTILLCAAYYALLDIVGIISDTMPPDTVGRSQPCVLSKARSL